MLPIDSICFVLPIDQSINPFVLPFSNFPIRFLSSKFAFAASPELSTVTPDDIYRWMCLKTYLKEDPTQTDKPLLRAASLEYWKKAISYFFNTTSKWNETSQTGNPTQSKKINSLIKVVKKNEIRGNGAESHTDRPFTIGEFFQLHDLIDSQKYKAALNFQYQLMDCIDDTSHVRKKFLQASTQFPGYLTTKIVWSKNVQDELNCPTQIMLPCGKKEMCPYLSLAVFLEDWIQNGNGAGSQWLFGKGTTTA